MCKSAVFARNSSWNWEFKCHRDNKSARRLSALDKCTARNSNAFNAARNQSSRRHVANRGSWTRQGLIELTTAALSHCTRIRKLRHLCPHKWTARRMARTSRWWIEGNLSVTSRGNSVWKKWWRVNPLQPDKHASVAKIASGDHSDVGIREMPS